MISFATCHRRRALSFLEQAYPGVSLHDQGPTARLLDLVEADVIRVQDPVYHMPSQIIPGANWIESRREEAAAIAQAFHDTAIAESTNEAQDQPEVQATDTEAAKATDPVPEGGDRGTD